MSGVCTVDLVEYLAKRCFTIKIGPGEILYDGHLDSISWIVRQNYDIWRYDAYPIQDLWKVSCRKNWVEPFFEMMSSHKLVDHIRDKLYDLRAWWDLDNVKINTGYLVNNFIDNLIATIHVIGDNENFLTSRTRSYERSDNERYILAKKIYASMSMCDELSPGG